MAFQIPSFDDILNAILTDYKNQTYVDANGVIRPVDTSQGSLIFIKSACYASALWGLYKYQQYISNQIFPDTADTENLAHHAWDLGITPTYQESEAELLARVLAYLRQPPAGGNANDYEQWALSQNNVTAAYCFPLAQGLGTVDVVILSNKAVTGSEVPTSYADINGTNSAVLAGNLVDATANFSTAGVAIGDVVINRYTHGQTTVSAIASATQLTLAQDIFTATPQHYTLESLTTTVKAYIDSVRPVTASAVRVLGPTILQENVTMVTTGANKNPAQTAADITAYMQALIPCQTLALAQLSSIAIKDGADDNTISAPAANVVTIGYQMIRPGVINVT